MSVKQLDRRDLSVFRPQLRRERRPDWPLRFSLLVSLGVHAAVLAAVLHFDDDRRIRFFILTNPGEEALEMNFGGAFDSAASMPRKASEIAEKRFEPGRPDPSPELRPDEPAESPRETTPLVHPVPPRHEPDRFEEIPAGPVRRRTAERRDDGGDEPANLSPPELPRAPEGREIPTENKTGEMRFASFRADPPETPPASRPEPEAEAEASTVPSMPREEWTAERTVPEARTAALTRRPSRRYHERETRPEMAEPPGAAAPAPASIASREGADRRVRGVRQRPQATGSLAFVYPGGARRRGETGTVVVKAVIDADGRCTAASIERSSGYSDLDAEAVTRILQARFRPASADGVPVAMIDRFAIVFQLR